MEGIVILLVLFLLWIFIAPIIAMVRSASAARDANDLAGELREMRERLAAMERELRAHRERDTIPPPEPPMPMPVETKPVAVDEPSRVLAWLDEKEAALETEAEPLTPPPLPWPLKSEPNPPPPPAEQPGEPFSLERFMGVKLFAWLGGVAMFFGVIFFVKYAFENNLIPPAVRVTLGFITGTSLLIGGLATHRLPKYRVLAQAFCATGVLILYGVSFAAHAIYHFAAFGPVSTFVLMALITLVAFLVAVRLNALVVAVLGMLGGFLTPVLLATGHDNVFALFGYIALLDIGLLAVSRHSNWRFLTAAAATGTALTQIRWYHGFFTAGSYFEGTKTLVPMGILLGFIAIFLLGAWLGKRKKETGEFSAGSVIGLAAVAMGFAFAMLEFRQVAERHFLLYGFVLALNLALISVVMFRPQLGAWQMAAAGATFFHLAIWSTQRLTAENLMGALALYLVFGALHAVMPVLLARRFPGQSALAPLRAGPWFAPLVLLMMLLPVFHLSPVPMILWAGILLANLLVIGLAVATGALLPVLASLVLTMGVAAMWLLRVPAHVDSLMPFLGVITGFSAIFAVAGRFLFRGAAADDRRNSPDALAASVLPVAAALLPFAMLILALTHLPVANPSPVFGVALLMTGLLAGLAVIGKQGPLVLAALIATLAVEAVWHASHFNADAPMVALGWYLGFYALFLAFSLRVPQSLCRTGRAVDRRRSIRCRTFPAGA